MPEAHSKPCYMLEYPKTQSASYAKISEIKVDFMNDYGKVDKSETMKCGNTSWSLITTIPNKEEIAMTVSTLPLFSDKVQPEMGNQQATQIEIGWLAGIIDGEGYLGFQVYKTRNHHQSISTELSVVNTDEQIIIKAQKIMLKIGVNPYINMSSYKMKNKPTHKNTWKIVVHRLNTVLKVLEVVNPYLTGAKQDRAILVLEYCKSRLINYVPGRHFNPMTEREAQIVDLCIAKQKRGASETTRKAQLEQSALCEQIRLKGVEKKREYDSKWQKDNRAIRNEQQRQRRSIEKNQLCSAVN